MAKIQKEIMIMNKQGLYARPAAMFVQIAQKYDSGVTVQKGPEKVNGKSIMGILMLGIQKGNMISVVADGNDAEQMMAELEEYLKRDE